MLDKIEKSASPKVIKWTEEEWASVANHLFGQKGAVLLSSPRLEEIRAKDVFLAQEALPEDRHRKLISIAQGFQGIRDRLSTIFQGMSHAQQGLPGGTPAPDVQVAAPAVDAGEAGADASVSEAPAGNDRKTHGREKKPQAQQAPASNEAAPHAAAQPVPAAADTPAEPVAEPAAAAAQPQPAAAAPARADNAQPEPAPRRQEPANGMQQGRERQKDRVNEARPQAQFQPPAPTAAPASTQASASFIDVARPFVAMVCEEMALALVKVLTSKGGEQQFGNMMQKAMAQFAPAAGNAGTPRPERQNQPRHERAPQPQQQPPLSQPPSPSFNSVNDAPERMQSIDGADDEGNHPAEVQPLFDPKLPPSANSDFKPTIGLVGSNLRELDDLQLLYPQLRLTVVAPDAVRSADVFRQCQRIIGLREDVAQPVDDLLRRLLRNRYIRIAGGIPRVREQLNSWLHNPNSINAEPRPHVPRGPKGPGQGQGQGQGQGDGGKKRHNRHLRSPRQG
jgi:outer membrane biosynthesis protein TonB